MTDKELADAAVRLGAANFDQHLGYWYVRLDDYFEEYDIVRDWRVAGALMEKCQNVAYEAGPKYEVDAVSMTETYAQAWNESLPRAIIEACVETLDV